MEPLKTCIRIARGSDLNFIFATWLNTMEDDSCFGKIYKKGQFLSFYRSIIDFILSKPDVTVRIVGLEGNDDVIYAYMVSEPGILHFIYTKVPFRRFGLARMLFESGAFKDQKAFFTNQTRMVQAILTMHPNLMYKPSALFQTGE